MKIAIRKAIASDISSLSHLFDLYRIFYNKKTDLEAVYKFLSERLNANDSEILLAENDQSTIVGFTQLYPSFSSTRMQRLWVLNDLYVLESYRGKGISKLLIEAAKKLAVQTRACGLLLETAKTNVIGNQLYPSTEFKLEDESNFYFWTNQSIKNA